MKHRLSHVLHHGALTGLSTAHTPWFGSRVSFVHSLEMILYEFPLNLMLLEQNVLSRGYIIIKYGENLRKMRAYGIRELITTKDSIRVLTRLIPIRVQTLLSNNNASRLRYLWSGECSLSLPRHSATLY